MSAAATHRDVLAHAEACTNGCVVRRGNDLDALLDEVDADYMTWFADGRSGVNVVVGLAGPWTTTDDLARCHV